jgi:hypothetical protein
MGHLAGEALPHPNHLAGKALPHPNHLAGEALPHPNHLAGEALPHPNHLAGKALPHPAVSLPVETTSKQRLDIPMPTFRPFLPDNQAFLPMFSPDFHAADEFAPLRCASASPLPPTRGKRNAPAGRWRTRIILTILAVLLLLAGSGGYIAFSKYWSGLNRV